MPTEEDETQHEQSTPTLEQETPRAAALRRGALAELELSSDVAIAPSTGAPRDGLHAQMTDRTDGEGWNDRTMGDLTDAQGTLSPPISSTDLSPMRPQSPFDEVPRGGPIDSQDEGTYDTEQSVTEVPHYDTMEGLSPVRPRPSMLWLALGAPRQR